MKLIGIGGAALAMFGAMAMAGSPQASAQQAHDYWLLGFSSDKKIITYIDAASIVSVNSAVKRAWVWTFDSKSDTKYTWDHLVSLDEVDCRTHQTHSLQTQGYDSEGRPGASSDQPELRHYVVPESLGERELEFICTGSAIGSWQLAAGVAPD